MAYKSKDIVMLVVGDSRSSHVRKWVEALGSGSQSVVLLSDFEFEAPIDQNGRRLVNLFAYLGLCLRVVYWRLFSKRLFHVHYVSRYSFASILIPSKRLYSYVYGSDVLIAPKRSRLLKGLISNNLKRSQQVVVSSPYLRDAVKQIVIRNDIKVVPFGVERKFVANTPELPMSEGVLRLGCFKFCRMQIYGFDRLIDIFSDVLSLRPGKARLYLIDDGPDLALFKSKLLDRKLMEYVVFLPKVDSTEEMFSYLQLVDITIYPSRSESFGVSLIESMAAGKPSFVSAVGGMKEIIENGENGYFCSQESSLVASRLCKLSENVEEYLTIANSALETIRSDYVWEDAFEQFRLSCIDEYPFNK